MGKIWEFFEHLDEYVYVSDPETNQLVYMNQKALKSYGFQSKEEIVGLKCYEVLQGNSAPCSICNNEQLRPGYFKEWEYYNPVVKRISVSRIPWWKTMAECCAWRSLLTVGIPGTGKPLWITMKWKQQ